MKRYKHWQKSWRRMWAWGFCFPLPAAKSSHIGNRSQFFFQSGGTNVSIPVRSALFSQIQSGLLAVVLAMTACEGNHEFSTTELVSSETAVLQPSLTNAGLDIITSYCEPAYHETQCISAAQLLLVAAQECKKSSMTLAGWNPQSPCDDGFQAVEYLCCPGQSACCITDSGLDFVPIAQCPRPLPPLFCDVELPVCCQTETGPTLVSPSECSPKVLLEPTVCQAPCVPKSSVESCQSAEIWNIWAEKQCAELGRLPGEITLGPACDKGKFFGAKTLCCGWKNVCCNTAAGPSVTTADECFEDHIIAWEECVVETTLECTFDDGCCPSLTEPIVAGSPDAECPKSAGANYDWQCWGAKTQCTNWGFGIAAENCDPNTMPDCPAGELKEGYLWRCWPDGTTKCTTKDTAVVVASGACDGLTKPTCPTVKKTSGPQFEWGCWEGQPNCFSYGYLVSPELRMSLPKPACSLTDIAKKQGYKWQCWPDGTLHCTFWGTSIGSTLPCRDLPKPNCGGTKKEGPNYSWKCWPDGSLKCTDWGVALGSTTPCKDLPKPTCTTGKKGSEPNYAWQCWGSTAQCTNWGYGVAPGACANLPKPDCGKPKTTDAPNYKWECWGETAQCTNWGTGVASGYCSNLAKPVCKKTTKKVSGPNLAWQCWGGTAQCTNWGIAVNAAQCSELPTPVCEPSGETGSK
ncbi:MAG: hypothetical protein HUU55_10020 [Myxococcales bacterium]|nr:hypothetical protein [Myxococcales bacterium]